MDNLHVFHALKDVAVDINELKERICALEKNVSTKGCKWVEYQDVRMTEMEDMLGRLVETECSKSKKPYKCPVCDGLCYALDGGECNPCNGFGIVWG